MYAYVPKSVHDLFHHRSWFSTTGVGNGVLVGNKVEVIVGTGVGSGVNVGVDTGEGAMVGAGVGVGVNTGEGAMVGAIVGVGVTTCAPVHPATNKHNNSNPNTGNSLVNDATNNIP